MKTGRVFVIHCDSLFEQSLVNDSSANTAYIYWRRLWGQKCCSV